MFQVTTFEHRGTNIGLVIEHPSGLSFHAAGAAYASLDGLNFDGLRQVVRAVETLARAEPDRRRRQALRRWRGADHQQDTRR